MLLARSRIITRLVATTIIIAPSTCCHQRVCLYRLRHKSPYQPSSTAPTPPAMGYQNVLVLGIPTRIYSVHPTVVSRNRDENVAIVVIPGNPGVIDFYKDFINSLFDQMGKTHSIIGGMRVTQPNSQPKSQRNCY
jgi:hypothetical protein